MSAHPKDPRRTLYRRRAGAGRKPMALVGAVAAAALLIPSSSAVASQIVGFSFDRPVDITNSYSGLKADVMWASSAPYQGVFLWPNNTSRSQEFDAIRTTDGYFRLRARHSGQCLMLDSRQSTYGNGTLVVQLPYCGRKSAEWRVRTVGDPVSCDGDVCTSTSGVYPTLQNRYTGRCLDAANSRGGRPPAQAVLQQWTCIGNAGVWNAGNQMFSVRNIR
ncbi:MAG: hypothetical protein QOJ89_2148 [bacterium]|jgi:hypothetical protein